VNQFAEGKYASGERVNIERKGMSRRGLIGKFQMKNFLTRLYWQLQELKDDRGQDLIEYALLVALVAFAATAGMSALAKDINTAFTHIGTTLTTYTG
jgi:pilus assembly protein Flp/PilA